MTNEVHVCINYAWSQVDKCRVGELAKAIQSAFQQMGIFDSSKSGAPLSSNPILPGGKLRSVETLWKGSDADGPDLANVQKGVESALALRIETGNVALTPTKEGIIVGLREAGLFDSGAVNLRPQALPTLQQFVNIVGPERMRIRIEGHTDTVPIHSHKLDSNWEISTARATEIIKLFITRCQIDPLRLSA